MARRSVRLAIGGVATAAVVAAAGFVSGGFQALAGDTGATAVFTVYMATPANGGSDSNSGLTSTSPVVSLHRVHEVLKAARPTTDVEVRVRQGTYVVPPMLNWYFYVPGHTVSFLPVDYDYGEGESGIAGRPVFRNKRNADGSYPTGNWLHARTGSAGAPLAGGGTSGLRFYYLQVEYYISGGVGIDGQSGHDVEDERYDPPISIKGSTGLNGNTFAGMVFRRIGNKWTGGGNAYGWGAIVLTNSSNNRITNSHFVEVENSGGWQEYLHGVYVTHFSSHNRIDNSRFAYISGDPIKTRDQSNFNDFDHNNFTRTGFKSFFRDQICDKTCAVRYSHVRECAAYHNRFVYNRVLSAYNGSTTLPVWSLDPAGNTYSGGSPCTLPAGEARVYTGSNTRT